MRTGPASAVAATAAANGQSAKPMRIAAMRPARSIPRGPMASIMSYRIDTARMPRAAPPPRTELAVSAGLDAQHDGGDRRNAGCDDERDVTSGVHPSIGARALKGPSATDDLTADPSAGCDRPEDADHPGRDDVRNLGGQELCAEQHEQCDHRDGDRRDRVDHPVRHHVHQAVQPLEQLRVTAGFSVVANRVKTDRRCGCRVIP